MAFQNINRELKNTEIDEIIESEKKYFDQLKQVDTEKNWERFLEKIDEPKHVRKANFSLLKLSSNLYKVAAAIILFILTSTTIYFATNQIEFPIQKVSSLENTTEIYLKEGSVVTLNKGSELSYNTRVKRNKREVHLKGEAFFNIAKNDHEPFYVYLDNATIKVLGTSFNLSENADGNVTIHVLSGKVSFYESGNVNNSIMLVAGESAIYNNISKEIYTNLFDSQNFLFWKTGNLNFNNQKLKKVFKELEECYKVVIEVQDSEILNNKLSSECKGQKLEDILNELAILFDLTYSQEGDTIYINKK